MPELNVPRRAKVIYITAGAGGMYCGSCLHDNALAKALMQSGWNVQLIPTYTPIRTDEQDVSVDHVLFGGLNVFLQQKLPLFRYLPMFVDRFLDSPRLIKRVTAKAIDTDSATLGGLALSMLQGLDGNQRKEVRRLVDWLQRDRPEILIFTNLLIGGCLPSIKQRLHVPVLVTLQGDDVFLEGLPSPYREKCLQQIKKLVPFVDGFIVHSEFFRDAMSEYFEIDPARMHVTPLGLDVQDYVSFLNQSDSSRIEKRDRTIGYLARLAPEKGLHILTDAFILLKQDPAFGDVKLKVAGWLGPPNLKFAEDIWRKLDEAGLAGQYQYLGSVDRAQKLDFFRAIDVLSVPTEYREPKGLYALEAMAAGVPIVVPDHGAFPELIHSSGGGRLFSAGHTSSLVAELEALLRDPAKRRQLGETGQQYVHQFRNSASMAESTGNLISQFLGKEAES
jgi:glycosyltransferase involved in cell wall biosynthesis